VTQQAEEPNDISRNFLLGNRKKIAKFLMRTFTCRSTFLYGRFHKVYCSSAVKVQGMAEEERWPDMAKGHVLSRVPKWVQSQLHI